MGLFICLFWVYTAVARAQNALPPSDADQIATLMRRIANHSASAEQLLDPVVTGTAREKALDEFRDPSYQITIVPAGSLKLDSGGRASVPARVQFKNSSSEFSGDVDLRFVQRNGAWYFTDFDFLRWSIADTATFVIVLLLGIFFAAAALILRRRLLERNMLKGANRIKILIPIFWPRLFSDTRLTGRKKDQPPASCQ